MAPSLSSFDPWIPARLDGQQAVQDYMQPIEGQLLADRYDMLNPRVQVHGEKAILTFNLITCNREEDGTEKMLEKWNAVEVYTCIEVSWKIAQCNWSYTKKGQEQTEENWRKHRKESEYSPAQVFDLLQIL